MGDLSENFDRSEFACKCGECDKDTIDYKTVEILERLREWADAPITVTSGVRCVLHNEKVGGSKNSQHLFGRAADIQVEGKTPFQVYRQLEDWYPYQYGFGHYDTFTHVDSRNARARWKG